MCDSAAKRTGAMRYTARRVAGKRNRSSGIVREPRGPIPPTRRRSSTSDDSARATIIARHQRCVPVRVTYLSLSSSSLRHLSPLLSLRQCVYTRDRETTFYVAAPRWCRLRAVKKSGRNRMGSRKVFVQKSMSQPVRDDDFSFCFCFFFARVNNSFIEARRIRDASQKKNEMKCWATARRGI